MESSRITGDLQTGQGKLMFVFLSGSDRFLSINADKHSSQKVWRHGRALGFLSVCRQMGHSVIDDTKEDATSTGFASAIVDQFCEENVQR